MVATRGVLHGGGVRYRCETQNEQYYTKCINARICDRGSHDTCMDRPLNTDDIIRRMRQAYAVKNDSELADALGLSVSAPSNWRQRNSPPFAICADIARKKGVSLDWLIFGVGDTRLGMYGDRSSHSEWEGLPHGQKSAAQRISQFVNWWHMNRTQDETIWLEQQLKRSVPEYGEWLIAPP